MSARVIVVGAGAAGLTAARTLSRAGIPVLILEARQRSGGRIFTVHEPGCAAPVELGAEFVHGRPAEIWHAIEAGSLKAIETSGEDWLSRNGRLERPDRLFRSEENLTAGKADGPDESFDEFAESQHADQESRQWAARYVEGFHAARTDEISARSLAEIERAEEAIGGNTFRLAGGYAALVNWLRADLAPGIVEIRCGTEVKAIDWRPGNAELSIVAGSRSERLRASRVICTVPLGVLAAGGIRFDPQPERLRSAIDGIAVGHAARITLRFQRPIWEDRRELRGLGFLFSDEEWMPTWWTVAPNPEPLIVGWTGGPRAETSPDSIDEWPARALATLGRVTGKDAAELRSEMVSWHAHNWATDPFSRGAYCYVRAGGMDAQRRFAEPEEDTIFFAGEAVGTDGHIGTVHGAMASGERAARLILDRMPR